jgi:predicted RNA-binding protein with PIN domain
MHYLVDAYNLLFRTRKKKGPLEQYRQSFIEDLNEIISKLHLQVTLVFDGAEKHLRLPSRSHFETLEIIYTNKGQTADEYIFDEVSVAKSPAQLTIVSNDRELTGRCRQHGAKTLTIDEFLHFLSKKKGKKKRLTTTPKSFRETDPEIARLLAIFEKRMIEEVD